MDSSSTRRVCYLMAVYNDPQGMQRTLYSLFHDDLLADILVIDDGSSMPLPVIEAPAGVTLHRISHAHNKGLVAALNTGLGYILERTYDYVARIDAGDETCRGRLMKQIEFMDLHPRVGAVGGQVRAFNPRTNRALFAIKNPVSVAKMKKILYVRNALAHPTAMIRADALRQCGIYSHDFPHAEDYELWRRLGNYWDLANLPDILVHKEITPRQITARYRNKGLLSRLRIQLQYFDWLSPYAWLGIIRSCLAFCVSRQCLLLFRRCANQMKNV